MTIFRAPLANSKGEVMLSMQATGVVPAQATQFRGLWVTMNGLICATNDTGQARKYVGGFALEDPSGLLLVTEAAPASVPMDGINANAAGAVVTKGGAASLIHQGVGMTVSEPGGPIVVNKDEPALTFYVGLENQVNSGSIQATQERSSEATYVDTDGVRKIAAENWIRQEFQNSQPLGTLMEPAITNICKNYNANPDAAFLNMSVTVGTGTLTREDQSAKLAESGLSAVCSSGFAFKIDSPTDFTDVTIEGPTNATGIFTLSAYIYCPQGEGFLALNYIGPESTEVPFSQNTKFERISGINNAVTRTEGEWRIRCQAGTVCYFVLNQLEEGAVVSSPIVTRGAAASRAVDLLSWPLIDPQGRNILNVTEGMCAIQVKPNFSASDLPSATNQTKKFVDFDPIGANGETLAYQNTTTGTETFRGYQGSGATPAVGLIAPLTKDQLYLVMIRWGSATYQVGYKTGGTTTWGSAAAYTGWNNQTKIQLAFPETAGAYNPMHGAHYKGLYVWGEDKGTAWLESFFSGVAN